MIKRIIIAAILVFCVISLNRVVSNTLDVKVSNKVMVDQVDPSDAPAIMVRSLSTMKQGVNIISLLVLGLGLWLTFKGAKKKEPDEPKTQQT